MENNPGVACLALAVGSTAGWLGYEASSKSSPYMLLRRLVLTCNLMFLSPAILPLTWLFSRSSQYFDSIHIRSATVHKYSKIADVVFVVERNTILLEADIRALDVAPGKNQIPIVDAIFMIFMISRHYVLFSHDKVSTVLALAYTKHMRWRVF